MERIQTDTHTHRHRCVCVHALVHVRMRVLEAGLKPPFVQDVEGMSPEHILTDGGAPPTQVCRSHI